MTNLRARSQRQLRASFSLFLLFCELFCLVDAKVLSEARVLMSSAATGHHVALAGGINHEGDEGGLLPSSALDVCDLTSKVWTHMKLSEARWLAATVGHQGRFYIIGGARTEVPFEGLVHSNWIPVPSIDPRDYSDRYKLLWLQNPTDLIEVWDTATSVFLAPLRLSKARFGAHAASVGDWIVIVGGCNEFMQLVTYVEMYNSVTGGWRVLRTPNDMWCREAVLLPNGTSLLLLCADWQAVVLDSTSWEFTDTVVPNRATWPMPLLLSASAYLSAEDCVRYETSTTDSYSMVFNITQRESYALSCDAARRSDTLFGVYYNESANLLRVRCGELTSLTANDGPLGGLRRREGRPTIVGIAELDLVMFAGGIEDWCMDNSGKFSSSVALFDLNERSFVPNVGAEQSCSGESPIAGAECIGDSWVISFTPVITADLAIHSPTVFAAGVTIQNGATLYLSAGPRYDTDDVVDHWLEGNVTLRDGGYLALDATPRSVTIRGTVIADDTGSGLEFRLRGRSLYTCREYWPQPGEVYSMYDDLTTSFVLLESLHVKALGRGRIVIVGSPPICRSYAELPVVFKPWAIDCHCDWPSPLCFLKMAQPQWSLDSLYPNTLDFSEPSFNWLFALFSFIVLFGGVTYVLRKSIRWCMKRASQRVDEIPLNELNMNGECAACGAENVHLNRLLACSHIVCDQCQQAAVCPLCSDPLVQQLFRQLYASLASGWFFYCVALLLLRMHLCDPTGLLGAIYDWNYCLTLAAALIGALVTQLGIHRYVMCARDIRRARLYASPLLLLPTASVVIILFALSLRYIWFPVNSGRGPDVILWVTRFYGWCVKIVFTPFVCTATYLCLSRYWFAVRAI